MEATLHRHLETRKVEDKRSHPLLFTPSERALPVAVQKLLSTFIKGGIVDTTW
jgi:hypothetical protein